MIYCNVLTQIILDKKKIIFTIFLFMSFISFLNVPFAANKILFSTSHFQGLGLEFSCYFPKEAIKHASIKKYNIIKEKKSI